MANDIVLDLKITVPLRVEPAGDMPDRWAEGLVNNASRIKDRMFEVLPDAGEYQSRVAEISSQKWKGMIAPGFVSKRGKNQANIIRAQYKGLAGAYNKFMEKYELAFATVGGVEAKRFKDQVNNSKDIWANGVAKSILRITGDRIRGLIIPQVVYWMTGDPLANRMNNHMELIAGNPYDFTKAGIRQQFKSAASSLLVTAGITILKADMDAAEVAPLAEAFWYPIDPEARWSRDVDVPEDLSADRFA